MKKLLVMLAMATAFIAPSQAETQIYSSTGYWSNYAGTGDKGSPLCGMVSGTELGKQAISIKWVGGHYRMFITKDTWRLTDNGEIPVVIGFDGRELPTAGALGSTEHGSGLTFGMLQLDVGPTEQEAMAVLEDVAGAGRMTIRFPQGTEHTWVFGMRGSRAAVDNLLRCIADTSARYGIPRFAGQAEPETTVPFDASGNRAAPATRQPYESDI